MSDAPSAWIFEPTIDTFEKEVVERSMTVPVVIDFWATWCQPCLLLAPILEKLANEYQGQFYLAKVETEKNPELAGAFGVQSIPLVVGIREGRPIDAFQGALSETQVREWLTRILPSESERLLGEAVTMEATSPSEAETRYRRVVELEPENAPALIGLGRVLLAQGKVDEVQPLVDKLEARGFLEAEAEQLKSQLALKTAAASHSGDIDEARSAASKDPQNIDLQVDLAETLAASGKFEEALDLCLGHIARDKAGAGVRAKEAMLTILGSMTDHELAGQYRRKLATLLY
jgi:putative thioredoxin